jgi:AcrR family transcriptional regulator
MRVRAADRRTLERLAQQRSEAVQRVNRKIVAAADKARENGATVDEVAAALGISRQRFYKLAQAVREDRTQRSP